MFVIAKYNEVGVRQYGPTFTCSWSVVKHPLQYSGFRLMLASATVLSKVSLKVRKLFLLTISVVWVRVVSFFAGGLNRD